MYFLATIELVRRQNIIYILFGRLLAKETDKFAFEIPINIDPDSPFIFAIVPITRKQNILKNYEDLRNIAKSKPIPDIPEKFSVLYENDECLNWILTSEVTRYINKLEKTLEMVYISDQLKLPAKVPLTLRLNFTFLEDKNPKKKADLIESGFKLAILLADRASKFRLSDFCKEKAIKMRKNLTQD